MQKSICIWMKSANAAKNKMLFCKKLYIDVGLSEKYKGIR